MVRWQNGRMAMPVSKQQVLAALAKVPSPDGTPLADTHVLSDVVVSDGKVFFSLTVDASVVKAWEPVRKAAEEAVRSVPGVQSALVALTAERSPSASARGPAAGTHGDATPDSRPLIRPIRFSRAYLASKLLLQSPRARAVSANRPRPSIWHSACATSD